MFKFKPTTALYKIKTLLRKVSRVFVISGGQGAGKTISILMLIIDFAHRNEKKKISIISAELSKMKKTVIKDFLDIMQDWNMFEYGRWNIAESTFTFKNGTFIEFLGLDTHDVGKGMRRDLAYFNEANKLNQEAYRQVGSRCKLNIIDFNPDQKFWGHDLIDNENFLNLTFKDNEYLSKEEVESILEYHKKGFSESGVIINEYWANIWKVYGLGEIGSVEGVIFHNWKVIDNIPEEARLLGYGLDFGYTNDPTAIVEVYKYNDDRIVNEICYLKGLSNREISKKITTLLPVYCDSAEPKSIAELQDLGINAYPVRKGADSIVYGIQIMQSQNYLVTANSLNMINELRKYAWSKDRQTNDKINKPIDSNNHLCDGLRYHEMETIGYENNTLCLG